MPAEVDTNHLNNLRGEGLESEGVDDGSDSDEDENYNMDDCAFDGSDENGDDDKKDNEGVANDKVEDDDYLTGWKWEKWETIGDDESIQGPPEDNHYDGPHGLRDGISNRFRTVLECVFQTTAMEPSFFQRLASQSNKYAKIDMRSRHSNLYIGKQWRDITTVEMIQFFGIMLRISMEPRKMGGYVSYFEENPVINIGDHYSVQLRGYNPWAKNVMSLSRFKQIRSAFHPEAGDSDCGDKCHQLRYFIRMFNKKARVVFELGPDFSFDEGGIAMRGRYCPVRMYNKNKPAKFQIDFFILADAKYYFIYHLDVYQGANDANIDIDAKVCHLPTTQKCVANALLQSNIANDPRGCWYGYFDSRYACPQLFAILLKEYDVRGGGTCKSNRIGFDSNKLPLANSAERGSFIRVVDKRLGMVITRWKDSKILQTISTTKKHGIGEVERQSGQEIIKVKCPNDVIQYQKGMGGVDRGDQHRTVGAGFANVAHFKKWYKKAFLGIADFSLLQAFSAWNLAVESTERERRGRPSKLYKLKKWEFYAVVAEEMMTYVHDEDEYIPTTNTTSVEDGHAPKCIPNLKHNLSCNICSMEERIRHKVNGQSSINNGKRKTNREYSRRKRHLVMCSDPNCHIVAHVCCPAESNVNRLPQFSGMNCFEIAHLKGCQNLFHEVVRNGKTHLKSNKNHPILASLKDHYIASAPRHTRAGRPRNTQPSTPTTLTESSNSSPSTPTESSTPLPDESVVTSPHESPRRTTRSTTQIQQRSTRSTTQIQQRTTRSTTQIQQRTTVTRKRRRQLPRQGAVSSRRTRRR